MTWGSWYIPLILTVNCGVLDSPSVKVLLDSLKERKLQCESFPPLGHSPKYWVTFYSGLAFCEGSILEILPAWMTGGP